MKVIIVKSEMHFTITGHTVKVLDCSTGLSTSFTLNDVEMDVFDEYQSQFQSGLITMFELLSAIGRLTERIQ